MLTPELSLDVFHCPAAEGFVRAQGRSSFVSSGLAAWALVMVRSSLDRSGIWSGVEKSLSLIRCETRNMIDKVASLRTL